MTIATKANMLKFKDVEGVFAWSPSTGEEASANPGDYFWIVADDDHLVDENGEPMVLAVKQTTITVLGSEKTRRVDDEGIMR